MISIIRLISVTELTFDFSTAHADEFHDWYDLEHIPERQRVPGFGACERWISVANPKHAVASYELDGLGVLQSPAYKAIAYENLSVWSKRIGKIAQRLLRHDGEQTLPVDLVGPAGAGGLVQRLIVGLRRPAIYARKCTRSEVRPDRAPCCCRPRR